jgi:hypothetical protein
VNQADEPSAVETSLQTDTFELLEIDELPDFLLVVQSLPENAIPPGCAADLIAVAEALIAQEQ